ncbi:MAG: TolC family protein [Tannerella sp.]|jgi:outer membrane protein TolC|nr:TolC family protein [Tannerella sp.]
MLKNKILIGKKMNVRLLAVALLLGGSIAPRNAIATSPEEPALKVTLQQAIDIALSDNPTIIVAGKEIELKKWAKKDAQAGLLPTAEITGAYSRTLKKQTMVMNFGGQETTIQIGTDNNYSGAFVVSLPVFAPALYKSINLTSADIELAVEKSRSSKLDMVNQVTKAYFQLLLTQDSYDVLLKSFSQAEANFNVINEMYKLGSVSEYDKIRADVQVRSLKPNLVAARNGVNLAQLQLKVLIGLDDGTDIEVEGNLKDYEGEMQERTAQAGEFSLADNSDLLQLDLNAELLRKNLELQKASFLPTVGASYNYTFTSMNNNYNIAHYRWFPSSSIAFQFSFPIFKANNFTKIRQTHIQISQLLDTRVNTERLLYMQMSSFLDQMSASSEQLASNKESVAQAEKGRIIAKKRYEVGKGTILELNDSEVALTQAQLTYNQSIYDYLVAKADLDKILGKEDKITNK